MATTVLVIEKDDPGVKLLAWGLGEEGFDVFTIDQPRVPDDGLQPDFIIFNTSMDPDDKRLWIETMRYLAPAAKVIDLAEDGAHTREDTGADAQLDEPFRVDRLLALMRQIAPAELQLRRDGEQPS